jgi:hypothetical protein
MTRHLGDRLTAFVDGEVDPTTRDRMLGHLAQCSDCRTEADAERQVKSRLSGMAAPAVSVELMLNLLSLDTSRGPGLPGGGAGGLGLGSPGSAPAPFSFATVPIRPPQAPPAGRPSSGRGPVRPQRLRIAAIGAVSLAAVGTGVWLVGDLGSAASAHPPAIPAQVSPPAH